MKQGYLFKIVLIFIVFFSVGLFFGYNSKNYDLISAYSEVFIFLTGLVAVIGYFYQKEKDLYSTTIDQVLFFRKDVLGEYGRLASEVRLQNQNYHFPRIKMDEVSIVAVKKSEPIKSAQQSSMKKTDHIIFLEFSVLNILEELSIRIVYSKSTDHPALNSIKPLFVRVVEENIMNLLTEREIIGDPSTYQTLIDLYCKWRDNVNRR